MSLISVVSPCYNEEENIDLLIKRITATCEALEGWDYEIVLIDDGSKDRTREMLCSYADQNPHLRSVILSRNHGHQLALSAGLSVARGDRIFILDADLQDPPEILPDMMAKMDDGAHVVYGQRNRRGGETVFKKVTAKAFYRILNGLCDVEIPLDTGDFRLMSRKALNVLNAMPERHRFIRGMVSWIGLKQEPIRYDRDPRFAGETKYTLRKMLSFAIDAITSFSIRPLRIASIAGMGLAGLAGCFLVYAFWAAFTGASAPGWASIVSIILVCSSIQLIVLGVIGEYVGRLYMEAKGRPLYTIDQVVSSEKVRSSSTENEVHKAIGQLEDSLKKRA